MEKIIITIISCLTLVGIVFLGMSKFDLWLKQRAITNCLESSYTLTTITDGGYTTNSKQINQQAYNFCIQAKGY